MPAPALVIERVEIQGGNGIIEANENHNLLIALYNRSTDTAAQVSVEISTVTPDAQIPWALSGYEDIPPGQSRSNIVLFQIRTLPEFVEGTPIDLAVTISSDRGTLTYTHRLYTDNAKVEPVPATDQSLTKPVYRSAAMRDLTPWDLGNLEPLWMAEDASCLLKAGPGKYVLWRPNAEPLAIENPRFIAHRLTRHGVVVGRMELDSTTDSFGNHLPHTCGVKWDPNGSRRFEPLTIQTGPYRFPKDCIPYTNVGTVYDLRTTPPEFMGFVTNMPTLHDVWDMNAAGRAVGVASVYAMPLDANGDGMLSQIEMELSGAERHEFTPAGILNWLEVSDRGINAGYSPDATMRINYTALLTTAAQFDTTDPTANSWRWLGPMTDLTTGGSAFTVALLANDAGMIAGYSAVQTGDPALDALVPTRGFRAPASGEFGWLAGSALAGAQPILTNLLDPLPGGLHCFPRAMNQAGGVAGHSDFEAAGTGGLNASPWNAHAVYWAPTNGSPVDLGTLGPVPGAPCGFSDAYAINDKEQIAGTSLRYDTNSMSVVPAAVLW